MFRKTLNVCLPAAVCTAMAALLTVPSTVFAECKEFKMVEYEDRVEVVCIGEPLTAAQKKVMAEEDKRQELEYKRKKAEDDRRQREADVAETKRRNQAEADRKKLEAKPAAPTNQRINDNRINFR